MFRVAVVNSKGGSGKTTLAVNLAAWYAAQGHKVAIVDYDPQGSVVAWVGRRPANAPRILGIKAHDVDFRNTRAYRFVDGHEVTHLIIDTPAAIAAHNLIYFCRDAHRVLVPVLPSAIDTHAAARLIQNLLLQGGLRRDPERLGVVISRARQGTVAIRSLQRFLQAMDLQIVGTLRDSQLYVRSAETGLGVVEMPVKQSAQDQESFNQLGQWLGAAELKEKENELRPAVSVVSTLRPPTVVRPAAVAPANPPMSVGPSSAPGDLPSFLRPDRSGPSNNDPNNNV